MESVKDSAKAEIAFNPLCQPAEAEAALRALDGVREVEFDASVRRLSVCFNPSRVGVPALVDVLRPYDKDIRVVAVITPCFHGFASQH